MKVFKLVGGIFAVVGISMLIVAFFVSQNTRRLIKEGETVTGTVIAMAGSESYAPVVSFAGKDGTLHRFTSSLRTNPPRYAKGDRIGVIYKSGDPKSARVNDFMSLWFLPGIFLFLGVIFALVGFLFLGIVFVKNRNEAWLKNKGIPIETAFQSVEMNTGFHHSGQHPYRVHTQWQNPQTGKLHIFKSENLWYDPTAYIDRKTVTVLIKRGDPKTYYMDLSFLPELVS